MGSSLYKRTDIWNDISRCIRGAGYQFSDAVDSTGFIHRVCGLSNRTGVLYFVLFPVLIVPKYTGG